MINGQQTTRVLHEATDSDASVLIRVIHVPRSAQNKADDFDNLVSRIVAATNSQNYIKPSDLMSNDRRQIDIERSLRRLDYQYLRKRETTGEARRRAVSKHRFLIRKEELARASAACSLDPVVVREGTEHLFEEERYPVVFPNSDPDYYLPRYWLMHEIRYAARGYPERAYATWLVLHFMWNALGPVLRSRSRRERFRVDCEHDNQSLVPLQAAIGRVFQGALAYFRANRGTGARAADVSTFFKRAGLHKAFATYWAASPKSQLAFERHVSRFEQALTSEG